jgi:hypothetical protein
MFLAKEIYKSNFRQYGQMKSRGGKSRRREEKRRTEKRKTQNKEGAGALKGREPAKP